MRKRSEVAAKAGDEKRFSSPEPRLPDGTINNCSLANFSEEASCQVCGGACPDRAKFRGHVPAVAADPDDVDVDVEREAIAETSAALARELDASNGLVSDDLFENPHAAKPSDMSPGFERITERIFVDDVEETYERLEKKLRIGEQRSERGVTAEALDEAETCARLAHRLFVTAVVEHARWQLENQPIRAAMWVQATRSLQSEKDMKKRSKTITDSDVEAMASVMYPDEWRAQEMRTARAKAMVDSLSNLAKLWSTRCESLQVIHGKTR